LLSHSHDGQFISQAIDADDSPSTSTQCTADCVIPVGWALRLHDAITSIVAESHYADIVAAVSNVLFCAECQAGERVCDQGDKCSDIISVLRAVSPHFTRLRTILRLIYELRRYVLYMSRLDKAIAGSHLDDLRPVVDEFNANRKVDQII